MRLATLALAGLLAAVAPALAQAPESFSLFIKNAPAYSPTGSELVPCIVTVPGGVATRQCTTAQISGVGGVTSFNLRTGAVTLTAADVMAALGYTPLNPANNLADVSSTSSARTNLGLGSAATQSTSTFLQTANNLSDLASASTARTNLGLGTAAVQASGFFLQAANNLSDVANAATARTNIGLAIPRGYKAGFVLSVDQTTPLSVVDYGPGQLADSTSQALIQSAGGGTLSLSASGAGGIDTGTVQANTWYSIFAISGTSGVSAIASAPAVFSTSGAIGSGSTTLGAASGSNITAGSTISVQGAGAGGTNLNTTVSGSPTLVSVAPTGTTTNSSNSITSVSSLTSVIPGLAINDSTGRSCIPAGTVITGASGSTITLSQNTNSSGCGASDTLTITGANVTLAAAAGTTVGETGGTTPNLLNWAWGVSSISGRTPMSPLLPSGYTYYRYVGSVKTDGSGHVLPFMCLSATCYWVTPPQDVSTNAQGTQEMLWVLSVPLGVSVIWAGSILSNSPNGMSMNGPAIQPPSQPSNNVGVAPQFDWTNNASSTANAGDGHRYTTPAGQLGVRTASTPTGNLGIVTYGWTYDWGLY